MLVGGAQNGDVAGANLAHIRQIRLPPCERCHPEGGDEQVGHRPDVSTVTVGEGVDGDEPMVKPGGDLVRANWSRSSGRPRHLGADNPSGLVLDYLLQGRIRYEGVNESAIERLRRPAQCGKPDAAADLLLLQLEEALLGNVEATSELWLGHSEGFPDSTTSPANALSRYDIVRELARSTIERPSGHRFMSSPSVVDRHHTVLYLTRGQYGVLTMRDRQRCKPPGTPQGGQFDAVSRPESQLDAEHGVAEATAWPAISYEERQWESQYADDGVSRRELMESRGPYMAAVVSPIAGIAHVHLPSEIDALAEEAATEIARFDAEVGKEVAPFSSILLRSESAASSRIENLMASAKAIALAELGDRDRRNAASIVSNARAMQSAIDLAERLDSEAILAMHEALLGRWRPEWTGHWRDEQVWLGGRTSPHTAMFVPPHHERVPAAMADLVDFMGRNDLPALVQVAIAHAQFETIHPFPDGNGRIGRALIHSLLRGKRLTRNITVPVSAGLLTNTGTYFDALNVYREGDPVAIVQRLSDALFAAIGNSRRLVGDLHDVRRGWNDAIVARSDSAAWKLADLLLRQPVIDSSLAQSELAVSERNTFRAIERLTDAGVLTEISGNSRNQRWEATEVLAVLDAFAERSGRRG